MCDRFILAFEIVLYRYFSIVINMRKKSFRSTNRNPHLSQTNNHQVQANRQLEPNTRIDLYEILIVNFQSSSVPIARHRHAKTKIR